MEDVVQFMTALRKMKKTVITDILLYYKYQVHKRQKTLGVINLDSDLIRCYWD